MKSFAKKISILLVFLIASIILMTYFDEDKIEIRNELLRNLITGTLSFWIATIILTISFFDILVQEFIKWKAIRIMIVTLIAIADIFAILVATIFTFWGSNPIEDAIVFQNHNNSNEKIICQQYLSGIPEDYNWRIIKTKNLTSTFRPIEIITDTKLVEELNLYGELKSKPLKESFWFGNNKYELESYMISQGEEKKTVIAR